MHNMPLVSMVIPMYNSEEAPPLCPESIKRRTYRNIEIIVVDSYSTDRTVKISKKYETVVMLTKGTLLWSRYLDH